MNASKGSRASTAELSGKLEGETEVDEVKVKDEVESDQPGNSNDELKESPDNTINEEENTGQEEHKESPQNEPIKSGQASPAQAESTDDTGLVLQLDQTGSEDPIVAETNTPVEAIPIDNDEAKEGELKAEEEKEKTEGKESLTVDLPPDESEGSNPPDEDAKSASEGNQASPPPYTDTPRPPSDGEDQPSVEPPVEKTTVTHPENQPEHDSDMVTRSPSSLDGKNDSAISSSSLSPEHDMTEEGIEDRQETPIIEVV